MKVPTHPAARIEFINTLISFEAVTVQEALEILQLELVPEEVRNSPLWEALKEEE